MRLDLDIAKYTLFNQTYKYIVNTMPADVLAT